MTSLIKRVINSTVAICIFCGLAFAQPAKPKAAVYIKGNPQGRDVLRMAVNTFLIKTGMYQMIAVDAIDIIAQEHIRQLGGNVSDNEIAKLGRDAGAQYVCVVERTEIDGMSYVTTSMVNVQSKIAEFSDMKELPSGERLISVVERQINAMLGINSREEQTGYGSVSDSHRQQPPSTASYPYVNGQTETEIETETYMLPSSYSSSNSRSDKHKRKSESNYESALEPFDPSAVYFFFRTNTVDSRDYGDKEYRRNARFGGMGVDIHGTADTRNLFGVGFFLSGGTYGDGINGFILGIEASDLFWLVKRHFAIPISIGFDWQPLISKIKNKVAAEFIDVMSESDNASDSKIDMRVHNFGFTPTIGLQIFISRTVSVYAGYAYNVIIYTGGWNASYKIPGKSYEKDVSGDAFKVPDRYVPLQDAKEQFWGVPGTLRIGLKVHTSNFKN